MRNKSKSVATWLALLGGPLGAHRFYLHGWRDPWAWLHPVPATLGAWGWLRLKFLGLDDALGAQLVPLLGLVLVASAAQAIRFGLMSAEAWQSRHTPDLARASTTWHTVMAVVLSVMLGGIALMSTIAYTAQKHFEQQATLNPSPVQAL